MDGFIREVSTKEELLELIERMPYIQTIQAPNGKVRKELYELSMKKYDDVEWVKVIKSVYLRMKTDDMRILNRGIWKRQKKNFMGKLQYVLDFRLMR